MCETILSHRLIGEGEGEGDEGLLYETKGQGDRPEHRPAFLTFFDFCLASCIHYYDGWYLLEAQP